MVFKNTWERQLATHFDVIKEEILSSLMPQMQPTWLKGMSTVSCTVKMIERSTIFFKKLPPDVGEDNLRKYEVA